MLQINKKYPMSNGQYYLGKYPKKAIVLHHTAGTSARSAINWWNNTPAAIGTAFVIDRDGTIYQTMDPDKWAYHVGVNGDNDYWEQASIGIEIVSTGRVHKEGNDFIFYPLFPNKKSPKVIPADEVIEFKEGRWKGYWQKYTDNQIKSIVALVKHLMDEYGITVQKSFGAKSLEFDEKLVKTKAQGIYSHSSLRRDKLDIIPQKELLEALKAL